MPASSADPERSRGIVCGKLPHFKNETTELQHNMESNGHILLVSPTSPEGYVGGSRALLGDIEARGSLGRRRQSTISRIIYTRNTVASKCRERLLTANRVRRSHADHETPAGCTSRSSSVATSNPRSRLRVHVKRQKVCEARRNTIDMEPSFIDNR